MTDEEFMAMELSAMSAGLDVVRCPKNEFFAVSIPCSTSIDDCTSIWAADDFALAGRNIEQLIRRMKNRKKRAQYKANKEGRASAKAMALAILQFQDGE